MVTPSRSASSGPVQTGRCWSRPSRRSTRSRRLGHARQSGTNSGQKLSCTVAKAGAMTDDASTLEPAAPSTRSSWHWRHQLRPRLDGLTDAEYFWEPVPGLLERARRGQLDRRRAGRAGAVTIDFAFPEPDPPPVTTIAWRLAHVIVGVLGDAQRRPLRRPAGRLPVASTYAGTAAGRWPSSTPSTPPGSPASRPSARRAWRARAARPRALRGGRWRPSCCTSTAS